jgi:GAF domain-containing protein
LIKTGELIGVLDLDSPVVSRFDEDDERFLVKVANLFISSLD